MGEGSVVGGSEGNFLNLAWLIVNNGGNPDILPAFVAYFGCTSDFAVDLLESGNGFQSHYKLSSLIEESGIRISYLEVQEDLLFKVERALINALNPPLNENEPSKGIASLRQRVGLTQRQLADLVGVTETTVRNWENNRSGVEWFERVAKLCDSLQCTPNDLFGYQKIAETEEKA
ncbi:helix-turn-helix domain-containing protein [Nostoc sp. XA010]|uniref:helix-turn-helix transcriptional regulator n=1 Tax=Nostoc sp. XA010 TaxID=2780407 RepID=UPI001E5914CE|nr:helix-turn-helix transcriptional regulator [Nostoc sp. XA010]MCC5660835.1 helix-turn-helix domain-containing protein [Nostoc sp. XA010]